MNFATRVFNWKMALLSASLMGGIVFYINLEDGSSMASVAAAKQGLYTFFFSGLVIRLCEVLSIRYASKIKALALATLLPASLAVGATYLVHSMKGTPKPFASTIPTILFSLPGFLYIGSQKRRSRPVPGDLKIKDISS